MLPTFLHAYPPTQPVPGPTYWLPFQGDEVFVLDAGPTVALIQGGEETRAILAPSELLYLGTLEGTPSIACEVNADFVKPDGWRTLTLRSLFGRIEESAYSLVGYASQLLDWHRTSRYCPVCGHLNKDEVGTWGRHCPNCGYTSYPSVTPAILALVHDGERRMLLTHKPGWDKRYSCIAGFVEPGESLEQCVQREVREEVGVEVTDVTYVGSQPWPFPHQLMVGYTARYVSGELHIEEQELDDAAWFDVDAPPEFPPAVSLAHYIINTWIASHS